jgi:hypothetical protein
MIQFEFDPAGLTRIAVFSGVVNDAELLGSYGDLIERGEYDPSLNDLVDLRGVERLEVSTAAVRSLAEMFSTGPEGGTRLALVAAKDDVFGMARMYEILRSDASEQIRVFRHRAEAEAWLFTGSV